MGINKNTPWFSYPYAKSIHSLGGKVKKCKSCKQRMRISKWDSWNQFLIRCPNCKKLNGERWNIRTVLWASFLLQPLSFFCTARPRNAFILISSYCLVALLGSFILELKILNQFIEVIGMACFLFFPMIVNGILLSIHNYDIEIGLGRKGLVMEIVGIVLDLFS